MSDIHTVLVAVDGSDGSIRAQRWAEEHVHLMGAALHIVTAIGTAPEPGYPGRSLRDLHEAARRTNEKAVADCVLPSSRVTGEVLFGEPRAKVVTASAGADLLVVGSRGHGAFAGLLLGSVSAYCARHAQCPVVVVPETETVSRSPEIVVGVDGSNASERAIRWAEQVARRSGDRLRLVTAIDYPVVGDAMFVDFSSWDTAAHQIMEKAKASLTLPEERTDGRVLDGVAGPILCGQARDTKLLVIGRRGHSRLERLLAGSVAEYCMRHAHCPVVLVP